jgi:hypothetical protein
MAEVVSPAVHVLDFGYQAPNPIDFGRQALAQTQPMSDAIARGNEARNQFLLNNLEFQHAQTLATQAHQSQMALNEATSQRALELAKWNHQSQKERAQLNYQRMVDAANIKADAAMRDLKEKGVLDDQKAMQQHLTRIGGEPVARGDNELDADYSKRLQGAIKTTTTSNITKDSVAAYSIQKQINDNQKYLSDPQVQAAGQRELQSAAQQPGVQAQADNVVNSQLGKWLQQVAPDNAELIQSAIEKAPGARDQILKNAQLSDQFGAFRSAAVQQAAVAQLKVTGSPAAREYATANSNLATLKQQYQDIAMTTGDNGRMVPKSWWSDVQNTVDSRLYNEKMQEQQAGRVAGPPSPGAATSPGVMQSPAAQAPLGGGAGGSWGNPTLPPSTTPTVAQPQAAGPVTFDNAGLVGLAGNQWNTVKGNVADSYHAFLGPNGLSSLSVPAATNTPDVLSPFYANGAIGRMMPSGSQIATAANGVMFGTPSAPLPLPTRPQVVQQPAAATGNFMFPPAPQLQPIPQGVSVPTPIPGVGSPISPMAMDALTQPYDNIGQTLNWQNMTQPQ